METSTTIPMIKFFIIAAFASAAVLFFFSFYTVTIHETTGRAVTGIGMITGKDLAASLQKKDMSAQLLSNLEHFSPGIWALVALVCAVAGILAFLNETANSTFAGTLAATIGAASLFILKSVVTAACKASIRLPGITTTFQFAYWAALLAFIVAAAASYICLSQKNNTVPKEQRKKQKIIGSLSLPYIQHRD